ncbi:MAG: radical SAM family heme chaperone HemW [Chlamydiae bacterium]|nr:radical SAM family heme chaperone HemW [Chlamydiota bacterium]MBI3266641.1 radical SAM family heme chaperone HemW [Chlamydiota bacterium]
MSDSLNLYIHIPFCPLKCPFCAFKTGVHSATTRQDYVEKLCFEITEKLRTRKNHRLVTLYMGGGSSNMLSTSQIKKILDTVLQYVTPENNFEATTEIHPKLISEKDIREMITMGFNRFSMGVQSFQDQELDFLKRGYTGEEVEHSIALIKKWGVENLNLDFILAIPGQTSESVFNTLEKALSFEPSHLSHYLLSCDEGSQFTREKEKGALLEMDEEDSSLLYEKTCDFLEQKNFIHYEISNWAQAGSECRHHLAFWSGKPYLGMGLSATSFDGESYTKNTSLLKNYLENPFSLEEKISCQGEASQKIRKIILGSRTHEGLVKNLFSENEIQKLSEENLLTQESDKIHLTRKGWLLNDYVTERLVDALL